MIRRGVGLRRRHCRRPGASPVFDDPDHWLARSGVFAPTRYATGRVPVIYGAGNMLIRRSVLDTISTSLFATSLRSPAAAMKSSSGVAAETGVASHGPTTRAFLRRFRGHGPRLATCCVASSVTAPAPPASSAGLREISAGSRAAGARASASWFSELCLYRLPPVAVAAPSCAA